MPRSIYFLTEWSADGSPRAKQSTLAAQGAANVMTISASNYWRQLCSCTSIMKRASRNGLVLVRDGSIPVRSFSAGDSYRHFAGRCEFNHFSLFNTPGNPTGFIWIAPRISPSSQSLVRFKPFPLLSGRRHRNKVEPTEWNICAISREFASPSISHEMKSKR